MIDLKAFQVATLARQVRYLLSIAEDQSRSSHDRDKAARDLVAVQNRLLRTRGINVYHG